MAVERFPIETSHVMMFAEAIGDPNPVYRDAAAARAAGQAEVIAPPTFVQASAHFDPDYILRPKIGQPWFGSGREATGTGGSTSGGRGGTSTSGASGGGSTSGASAGGSTSGGRGGTGLHAEQHYEYARTLRVGDVLTATVRPGRTWEKEGRRAGTLAFSEMITEYRDQTGELVVTARSVGVVTSRPVETGEAS